VKLFITVFFSFALLGLGWFTTIDFKKKTKPTDKVSEVLHKLGDDEPNHFLRYPSQKSIDLGKQLFHQGFATKASGKRVRRLSKHFVCTSCHNVEKEFNDLSQNSAQARLDYAAQNQIPFLQGSPMYGAVNRISFYNGDYYKKYGKLVDVARNNLREAIQLCAIECAQGRKLKDSEIEAILSYLWTLGLDIEDLKLDGSELNMIDNALVDNNKSQEAIRMIKSKYMDHSPATFSKPPPSFAEGYGLQGNPENGKHIYELSCLHCHENARYSFLNLDKSKFSFKYLRNHVDSYSHSSIYQVGRYGTPPRAGKKAYMPQYTQEKMTNQQMEDLRAYFDQQAK